MEQYPDLHDGIINISDVIEVIQTTDPGFVEYAGDTQEGAGMISGGGVETVRPTSGGGSSRSQPTVEIVEQPASKALRFRYECEGRSAGSIPGVNSMPENKTFPCIRIIGYKGRAVVVVSCVTKDRPYRPHPHNLVGKEGCKRGVCTVEIASENMTVTFANLGIQCVKKKDIEEALKTREEIRVDPFRTGFSHRSQPTSIDLNAVRLCFQVFLEGAEKGKFAIPLAPVVSEPIYDKKAMSDLVICKLSDCSASVAGGKEMILLCEKVAKEDIQVRFFEERDGQLFWEGYGDFQPTHVHKQVAIAFRTPSYRVHQVDHVVQVYIQLKRPSDGASSEALPFQLLPLGTDDPGSLKRKRQKFNNGSNLLQHVQAEAEKHGAMQTQPVLQYNFNLIKPEPAERSPPYGSPYGGGITAGSSSPLYPVGRGTPSPQPSLGMQTPRQQASPGCALSPMDYTYNIPAMHPQPPHNLPLQYQLPNHSPQGILSQSPALQQQHPYIPQQQTMILKSVTPADQHGAGLPQLGNINPAGAQSAVAGSMDCTPGVSSVLDMDNQQYSFDLNHLDSGQLAELNIFDTNGLPETFSSNLSLSDIKTETSRGIGAETANAGGSMNMTDSFTRLTNNAIQDLCTLNNMYKSTRDNAG